MSAIASSYKMTKAALLRARDLIDRKEYQQLWEFMGRHEVGTLPYSGYVLAAVIPFAQKQGIEWPRAKDGLFSRTQQQQLGILCCGNSADYQNAANGLIALQATDAELRQYYGELYGSDWDQAATAMRSGFAFIQQGIRSLNSDDELLIISVC